MILINNKFKGIGSCLVMLIIGLLLLVIPYDVLKDMIFTIIGIAIVVINIIPCFLYWYGYKYDNKLLAPAIFATLSVTIGFVFIFWHNWIVSVVLAIWLIVLPIYRICVSNEKKNQAKKEIPYFIVALLLFFVPFEAILGIVLKIFGGILLLWAIINMIVLAIKNKNNDNNDSNSSNSNNNDRIVIDAEVKDL